MRPKFTKRPTDTQIARRWSEYRQKERDRYARTVAWLRACAIRHIEWGKGDVFILSECPLAGMVKHHQGGALIDLNGRITLHCRYCLGIAPWHLEQYLKHLVEV